MITKTWTKTTISFKVKAISTFKGLILSLISSFVCAPSVQKLTNSEFIVRIQVHNTILGDLNFKE